MSGSFDYHELKVLTERIGKELANESLMPEILGKVGLKFIRQVKAATPVGQYSNNVSFITKDGKHVEFSVTRKRTGGKLRRNWHLGQAGKSSNGWSVEAINNTEYAEYVNNGHRIVNRKGQQVGVFEGYHFMEKTAEAFEPYMDNEAEKAYKEKLKRMGF